MEPTISYPVTVFDMVNKTLGQADAWPGARLYLLPDGSRVEAWYEDATGEVFFRRLAENDETQVLHSELLEYLADPVTQALQTFLEDRLNG